MPRDLAPFLCLFFSDEALGFLIQHLRYIIHLLDALTKLCFHHRRHDQRTSIPRCLQLPLRGCHFPRHWWYHITREHAPLGDKSNLQCVLGDWMQIELFVKNKFINCWVATFDPRSVFARANQSWHWSSLHTCILPMMWFFNKRPVCKNV